MIYEIVRDMLCTKSGMVLGIIQDMSVDEFGHAVIVYMDRCMNEGKSRVPLEMIQVA